MKTSSLSMTFFLSVAAISLLGTAANAGDPPNRSRGGQGVFPQDNSPRQHLEAGQPDAIIHFTREKGDELFAKQPAGSRGTKLGSSNLFYHGGLGGIGVETTPTVYLVFWGSQWKSAANDPQNLQQLLPDFLTAVGGSSWLKSVTQFCQGIASGTSACTTQFAGNGISIQVWFDTTPTAPTHPTQAQVAAEAVRAAGNFQATSSQNPTAQYVIATAHNNNSSGFGSQYCAYHSYTNSNYGNIAYTNLPYIPDAGANCGAFFVNKTTGIADGVTIVEGHELAETITDQFPSSGWLDSSGYENGDKCAWSANTANVAFGNSSYPVQPLWSNSFNSGKGGCVMSYP